jgi:hypothetical protein
MNVSETRCGTLVSIAYDAAALIAHDVPEPRIVAQGLWDQRVPERQEAITPRVGSEHRKPA